MKIVSVVNYKGGVGKTTLTANIGAGLAARGKSVLLVDLDPQASLTYSFYTEVEFNKQLANKRTIKQWYDGGSGPTATRLADLVVAPPRVTTALAGRGRLDLIASDPDLVSVDALLAGVLDSRTGRVPPSRFVKVYSRLATGLADAALAEYDIVLIDCAPNFNMMTKNAVIASGFLLIPARPDYLSTNGVTHLGRHVYNLVDEYNDRAREDVHGRILPIVPPSLAVAFTMVSNRGSEPVDALGTYMSRVHAMRVPTFSVSVRDRKAVFAIAPERGVPVVLLGGPRDPAAQELRQLVDEFLNWIERKHR